MILLPAETDERLWRYFGTSSIPDRADIDLVLRSLGAQSGPSSLPSLEGSTGIRRARLEALLTMMAVDGVVERRVEGWSVTGVAYVFDQEKWDAIGAVREQEADQMRTYAQGKRCLIESLQLVLDDPYPGPCGTCSVCTGVLPMPGGVPSVASIEAAPHCLRGRDILISPRVLWPRGVERRGRIGGPGQGRALLFADDPAWAVAADAVAGPDEPLSVEVFEGIVRVLARWRAYWKVRPRGVVPMPSRHHGHQIIDLAERIAVVGRLPVLDVLESTGPPPPQDGPAGRKAAALLASMSVRTGVTLPGGPLLVLDDRLRSGWTMTVAGVVLREAGASEVLPLVVQRLP